MQIDQITLYLADEQATLKLANVFAKCVTSNTTVYLYGDLGAGKTCFSRGVIQALNFNDRVKSPTFTLVELYQLDDGKKIAHFDFYRLNSVEEAAFLDIDSYVHQAFLCLIEWPEKAMGCIPQADIKIDLQYLNTGRKITIAAHTAQSMQLLNTLRAVLAKNNSELKLEH